MNNHRWYIYEYQAVLYNGTVQYLGSSTSETYLNGGALSSSFGGISAVYEEAYDDDSADSYPEDLIRIVHPEDIRKIWDERDISWEKREVQRMLDRCGVLTDQVVGFIVTVRYQDNFYDDWVETTIVSRQRGLCPDERP